MLIENVKTFIKKDTPKEKSTFDQKPLVPLAMKWLNKKFPKDKYGFNFNHNENLSSDLKSYAVSVDGKEFEISGKLFDTNSDGTDDTVVFRINQIEEEPDQDEPFSK